MAKRLLLSLVIIPAYLLSFTVVHEVGHTLLARLLGDRQSTFYLVQIDPDGQGMCLGCNITDHTRLSPVQNLVVSVGGLLFTQLAVAASLLAAFRLRGRPKWQRWLVRIALITAFLDVLVQVVQGLLYDWGAHAWPTNVDLMDAMKLVIQFTGLGQDELKVGLFIAACAYLALVLQLGRKALAAAGSQERFA